MKPVGATKQAGFAGDPHLLQQKALELAGGDHVTARRLLEMIAQTDRTALAALRDSFRTASWDGVGSAAHRIAGSARMLECHEVFALLTRLEAAARGRDIVLATALLPHVADALGELGASIGKALTSTD
ncbi:hpt domain protein [Paraburkholderia xenovorans LB400]|jgi:HPt (histidine-containing phosphotransfer) domain-containing protein|uniref:Hpt domain protein n=1 Tax=Paraburkholderia xenovorans (strain LB400) TaxID=266265 RepID=Q13S71_PARXL|nr:Hpt domain-containing protein [Paraburkholderia xenovorans]ABE33068.1 Hpt domain protein [Paraburkholderia xenovorans LB400]AIP36702.1 hpt domain protein [Paraburkholderia xenovorans LB400]